MKYVVHYQCSNRLFTTLCHDLEGANFLADHLKECGFEGVIIEACSAQDCAHG
jgi:coenzyme F420-reducing hydrogenase delta subunit